jgi:uroporphyrinogen III methyltransferase/synthase
VVASDAGRPSLVDELAQLGADVTVVAAYRHVQRMLDGPLPPVDLIVLPSSSAARAVLASTRGAELRRSPMLAIGPVTEAAARTLGATHVARTTADTIPAMVATVLATLEAP